MSIAIRRSSSRPPRRSASSLDTKTAPYLYIAPFFVLFAIIGVFPLIYTVWVSLHSWSLIGGDAGFVGAENYASVITNPLFWIALRNTLSIFALSVVPQLIIATAVAAALASNLRARTFWRMTVLLPYVVAPVAVALIFGNLFGDDFGLVNVALRGLGLPTIGWHTSAIASQIVIATMVNFRWIGYNALILLAAMQAVPQELYDASAIDGAGKLRTFISITLPQIRPTLIFVTVTASVGGLQIFDEPRLYDSGGTGGPNNQWLTLTMYIYNLGFGQQDFGRASAVAFLLLGIIVIIGLTNFSISRLISSDGRVTSPRTARRGRREHSENSASPGVTKQQELVP